MFSCFLVADFDAVFPHSEIVEYSLPKLLEALRISLEEVRRSTRTKSVTTNNQNLLQMSLLIHKEILQRSEKFTTNAIKPSNLVCLNPPACGSLYFAGLRLL